MEQHPIPRQITSFEFKLIGFMTLKQFLYLIIFFPLGYIVYFIFPLPIINIILAIIVAFVGIAFAFFPINDRPLDIWLRNIWKRLNSPTQYTYHKHNPPVSFFNSLYFVSDPHHVIAHIESQQKLGEYLAKTKQVIQENARKKQVQQIIQTTPMMSSTNRVIPPIGKGIAKTVISPRISNQQEEKKPFFVGFVKNGKQIPLSGVLVYVKNKQNIPVRLMKTNPHGIFATFNPLSPGEYEFEVKDPKNTYFFDTMKITIQERNDKPIEFISKEVL